MNTPTGTSLDITTLPALPQILTELIDACNDEESGLSTIADIVARDVTITARIIKLANSAFIGARSSFSNIQQAVSYLGIDTVRNLAISVSIHDTFRQVQSDKCFDLDRFWFHSLLTAIIAKELAILDSEGDPAEAYLTGLLHDLGRLVLWTSAPAEYGALLEKGGSVETIGGREEALTGMTHWQVSALLMQKWKLNDAIVDAVRDHDQPMNSMLEAPLLSRMVYAANLLSKHDLESGGPDEQLLSLFPHLKREDLQEIMAASLDQIHDLATALGITVKNAPLFPQHNEDVAPPIADDQEAIVPPVLHLTGALDNLLGAHSQERIIQVVEESIEILFDITTSLLFLPATEPKTWQAEPSASNRFGEAVKGFHISANSSSLLHQCAEQRSVLHSFEADTAIAPFDKRLTQLLAAEGLTVLPITSGRMVLALLVIASQQEEYSRLQQQLPSLLLLARYIAMRLQLIKLHRDHAQQLAQERTQASALLAQSVVHEINNPLAIIKNYLTLLPLRMAEKQDFQKELTIIRDEIDRIATISKQLEDLSSTSPPPPLRSVDINSVVDNTVTLFKHSIGAEKKLAIHLSTDNRIPTARTSPHHIQQILINLLKNGAEAVGRGIIMVSTSYTAPADENSPHAMHLTVEDDGPGVASELEGELFTGGFTTKRGNHHGLGLAIVKSKVTELGGDITYERPSKSGSRFVVYLPLDLKQ